MTLGKASLVTMGFLGAVALGVAIGPSITDRGAVAPPTAEVAQPVATAAKPATTPRAKATTAETAKRVTVDTTDRSKARVQATAPELQARLKPVLNRGANLTMAADGFRSAEQFAAVAHAARNTEVPFMLLKHRVLEQGKDLESAIRESKPDLNALFEAERARAEARTDVADLGN